MKNEIPLLLAGLAFFIAGCKSTPAPKARLERGWIGGEYCRAKKGFVPKGEQSSVYVKQIYAGTPAETAGLKPGDLILAIDDRTFANLKEFRRHVDSAKPGSRVMVRVLRDREQLEVPVTIGRETYQQWHSFVVGLGFSPSLDIWPNPDFSLLPVAQYKLARDRLELRSPEEALAKQAGKRNGNKETGTYSSEGWEAWFLLFGFNGYKQILKQETVTVMSSNQ